MDMTETISLLVGIIGTVIAVYQTAVINEGKKRKNELQYIIAGINSAAVQKQQAWQNQISLLAKPETPDDWKIVQLHIRARDDAAEIGTLTAALEGTIDTDNSAIVSMMDKYSKIVEKNNALQELGMKNPTFNSKSNDEDK